MTDWIESSPGVNKNATTTLSDTENISVTLETTTSVESQVTGGSSSQVCITPPRYENEPYIRAREKPPPAPLRRLQLPVSQH